MIGGDWSAHVGMTMRVMGYVEKNFSVRRMQLVVALWNGWRKMDGAGRTRFSITREEERGF